MATVTLIPEPPVCGFRVAYEPGTDLCAFIDAFEAAWDRLPAICRQHVLSCGPALELVETIHDPGRPPGAVWGRHHHGPGHCRTEFNDTALRRLDRECRQALAGHELAHAWLWHQRGEGAWRDEDRVNRLAAQWGLAIDALLAC